MKETEEYLKMNKRKFITISQMSMKFYLGGQEEVLSSKALIFRGLILVTVVLQNRELVAFPLYLLLTPC